MSLESKLKLFKIHSNNQIGDWTLTITANDDGTATMRRTSCKVIGGKAVETITIFSEGKNIGRANETTPLEQALIEAASKHRKQLDKGYVVEMPKEGDQVTNSLGFKKPMLATAIEKVKKWDFPVYASPKLDGHRMLATVQNGQVVLYSRQGKILDVEHIRSELQELLDQKIWDGTTVDGEVYVHGETLQRISSLVKKPTTESKALKYYIYDMILDVPYEERKQKIYSTFLLHDVAISHIKVTAQHTTENDGQLALIHSTWLAEGYEGTIVRHGDTGYEDGKRSRSLMKKKDFQDAEFKIISVEQGKPVIKSNCTYQVAIYGCNTKEGKYFTATAPGTMREKHDAWSFRADAIGKLLTVKFFNYTKDGIPFLPVALRIREDV